MSFYKSTLFLICVFIFLSSANSLIRQVTDDFIARSQPTEEAEPIPDVDNGGLNLMSREISSSSSSSDSTITGLRDDPPSSYSLKMESFTTVFNSVPNERYESRPFTVGGFNWTLIVYPQGNKNENGTGFISMYVEIDKSNLIPPNQGVHADLTFYIYNNIEKKYFTIQDSNVWRFNESKTMLGYSQVIAIDTFTDLNNGYIFDDDHCEFGVDVIIQHLFQNSERYNVTRDLQNPIFNWLIPEFSTLLDEFYLSDEFIIGGRSWYLKIYPNGYPNQEPKYLSLSLALTEQEKLKIGPYEQFYTQVKFRLLREQSSNYQFTFREWFSVARSSWGYRMIQLPQLPSYLVNDVLRVQVEIEAISTTTYFP